MSEAKKPFFARLLNDVEMQETVGGDKGGQPNANANFRAFLNNPNVEPIAVTLKAGKCGNDCDLPDGDGDILE